MTRQNVCITTRTGFFEPLYICMSLRECFHSHVDRPKNCDDEMLPLVYFCHGGGFCLGHIATYEKELIKIARECHVCVIYCDYRMAPEYKCPIAVQDCYDALIVFNCVPHSSNRLCWTTTRSTILIQKRSFCLVILQEEIYVKTCVKCSPKLLTSPSTR